MTTTNHSIKAAAIVPAHDARVTPLDAHKRRKWLQQLLSTRTLLATMAAQQRSHRLPEADETFGLLLIVESSIRAEFPDQYDDNFAGWLEADNDAEHPPAMLTADCGICRSIASASGINLVPLGAA